MPFVKPLVRFDLRLRRYGPAAKPERRRIERVDHVTAIAFPLLAFALALPGVLLGSVIQRMLPEGHLQF